MTEGRDPDVRRLAERVMIVRHADDCLHTQWCQAKRTGEHSPECPTQLRLAEGDVDAFCARYVTSTVFGNGVGDRYTTHYTGVYDGRTASSYGMPEQETRRWLAENLIKHERLGTPRRL